VTVRSSILQHRTHIKKNITVSKRQSPFYHLSCDCWNPNTNPLDSNSTNLFIHCLLLLLLLFDHVW
jgi:hypothetical protein